ncbi:MAG: HesA/MoeB/ThiF family protein [Moraxella sp.]
MNNQLSKNKSLQDELSEDELLRYSRQILLDEWDIDAQINLKNSRVLIIGAGGLGCPVSQILTRAGVGYLCLIDFDVIEESNLQRQSLFTQEDIGQYKAKKAYEKLKQQNHLINIEYHNIKISDDNINSIFNKINPDLVIDCTDNFKIRDLLNKACRQLSLPLLSNSAIGEIGQIALFTKDTGCYNCLFGHDKSDENNCAVSGVLASTVHIIGAMTAQIALDFLGRNNNPIANQLLLWQGFNLSLKKIAFRKNSNCLICQSF